MKPPFTRTVTVPKRDATTGEIMRDADRQAHRRRTMGEFTFKRPTLREELRSPRASPNLPLVKSSDSLSARALDIATILAELPVVVTSAPDKWAWDDLEGDEDFYRIVAVWNAYQDGRREIKQTSDPTTQGG